MGPDGQSEAQRAQLPSDQMIQPSARTAGSSVPEYVMIKPYITPADRDTHFASEDLAAAMKTLQDEELLAGEIKIANCVDVAGSVR